MDWSGNKPLDYRKQRTTVSASTYNSEYDLFKKPPIPSLGHTSKPFRSKFSGGTVRLSRSKKRSHLHSTTIAGVNESQLAMEGQCYNNNNATSDNKNSKDSISYFKGKISVKDNYGTLPRRKESFLRKTLRAATAKNKNNQSTL